MKLASCSETPFAKKLFGAIDRKGKVIGALLFLAGVLAYCFAPNESVCRGRFFDENALLPGLAQREFANSRLIDSLSLELQNHPKDLDKRVLELMGEFGLETYMQNFTAEPPVIMSAAAGKVVGTNVYGILRAGRSASTEALVLMAPSKLAGGQVNYGVAVLLALAHYFPYKRYWAKDVVFLVSSEGELGVQAWLSEYTGEKIRGLHANGLPGRSGTIQASINLELPSLDIDYVDIIASGVNNILPNLDLVYVAVRLCEQEGLNTAFHVPRRVFYSGFERHLHSMQTASTLVAYQAAGLPFFNHALFLRHRIDSLTLRTSGKTWDSNHESNALRYARMLEGIFRSLNNLLEKLHHSEFYYLTPSRDTFLSLGRYFPPLGLLLGPMILECLRLWSYGRNGESSQSYMRKMGIPALASLPLSPILWLLMCSMASGVLLLSSPQLVFWFSGFLSPDGLLSVTLTLCFLFSLTPLTLRLSLTLEEWQLSKSLLLLATIISLFGLSLMNFPLSLLVVLTYSLPFSLSSARNVWSLALLVLCSPPVLLLFPCLVLTTILPSSTDSFTSSFAALAAESQAFAYTSYHLAGAWLYPVLCLFVWPSWFVFWCLSLTAVRTDQ